MSPMYVVKSPRGYLLRAFNYSMQSVADWVPFAADATRFDSATQAAIACVELHLGDDCRFEPYVPPVFVPPPDTDETEDDGSCSQCHGSGGGDEPTTRCPHCHGTGAERRSRYTYRDDPDRGDDDRELPGYAHSPYDEDR